MLPCQPADQHLDLVCGQLFGKRWHAALFAVSFGRVRRDKHLVKPLGRTVSGEVRPGDVRSALTFVRVAFDAPVPERQLALGKLSLIAILWPTARVAGKQLRSLVDLGVFLCFEVTEILLDPFLHARQLGAPEEPWAARIAQQFADPRLGAKSGEVGGLFTDSELVPIPMARGAIV